MTTRQVPGSFPLIAALVSGCAGAPKQAAPPPPVTPCEFWAVTVENEFPFPVSVYVYAAKGRTSLGAVFPGTTELRSSDSGQITFTPPLGMSLIARGRQIRGVIKCAQRTPN